MLAQSGVKVKNQSVFLLIFIGFLLLSLTACVPEDIAFMNAMADEWARAKNLNPINEDGSINLEGAFNGFRASALGSGDPETDAVIQAGLITQSIKDADDLADKALANRDLEAADKAIKIRPNDYHYQVVASVIMLSNGTVPPANEAARSALETALQQNPNRNPNEIQAAFRRDEMNTIEQALSSGNLGAEGRTRLTLRYCQTASEYRNANDDSYYVQRAQGPLKLNCR